jgi:hypothetical protein
MKSIPYKWVLLKPISYRVVRPEIQSLYPYWGTIRNKLRTQIEYTISQKLSDAQKAEIDNIEKNKAAVEAKVEEAIYNIATAHQLMANNRQNRRQTLLLPVLVFASSVFRFPSVPP